MTALIRSYFSVLERFSTFVIWLIKESFTCNYFVYKSNMISVILSIHSRHTAEISWELIYTVAENRLDQLKTFICMFGKTDIAWIGLFSTL